MRRDGRARTLEAGDASGVVAREPHALATTLSPADEASVRTVEIKRGDITVHDQRVVHGSGPNNSEGWRRAYVLAFRTKEMVEEERRLGFSHSHNDEFNWDAFHAWQEKSDVE